jgi:hypothetical protein
VRGLLRSLPPFKWLLVLPQLTSRVCHPHADVAEVVTALLVGGGDAWEGGDGGGRRCVVDDA